jgi:UDP-glucose 4-epimerase
MKCLVTGAAGFIGSNLVDALIEKGYDVIAIDNCSADNEKFYWNKKADNHMLDVCDYDAIRKLFDGVDFVFHLAAESRLQSSIMNPIGAAHKNVIGTCTVLQCSKEAGVKRIVYSSTSSIYGMNKYPNHEGQKEDCLNPYAFTKLFGEKLCQMYTKIYGLPTVIFRYFNVYGERSPATGQYLPVVGIFLKQFKNNEPLTIVGTGEQRRDFIHVKDIARINIAAIERKIENYYGEVFNVGTGTNFSVKEIADLISENQKTVPSRSGEALVTLANIEMAKRVFSWKPEVDIKDWIKSQL